MPDVTKAQLRSDCRAKRSALPPDEKKVIDSEICRRISALPEFRRAKKVFLYVPLKSEVDVIPLAKICRREGKILAFPVTDPVSNSLTFREFRRGDKLISGAYGIKEPPIDSPLCTPDKSTLCVLPALAYDRTGNRLGQGKGCYDRFLSSFDGVSLGIIPSELLLESLPHEEHDKPVSLLVTEKGILRFGEQKNPFGSALQMFGEKAKDAFDTVKNTAFVTQIRLKTVDLWHKFFRKTDKPESDGTATEKVGFRAYVKHNPPILVAVTFLLVLLSRLAQDNFTRRGSDYIGVILLQVLIFLIPSVIYIRLRDEKLPERIKFRNLKPKDIRYLGCLLVMMISGSLLLSILTGGISSLTGNFTLYNTFLARTGGRAWETVYLVLAFGILPAFCEELVFRSLLCAEYESVGNRTAIIVSTLFFAMLHFSWGLFPVYLWLGFLLCCSMYATRTILAPMLLHLVYNLFCLFGQPYLSAFYVNAGSSELFIFCLVVLLLLFSAFTMGESRKLFHLYARKENSGIDKIPPISETAKLTVFSCASPAVAVCFVLWIIGLVTA